MISGAAAEYLQSAPPRRSIAIGLCASSQNEPVHILDQMRSANHSFQGFAALVSLSDRGSLNSRILGITACDGMAVVFTHSAILSIQLFIALVYPIVDLSFKRSMKVIHTLTRQH